MILLIDIGNSSTTIGLHDRKSVIDTMRIDTDKTGQDSGRYFSVLSGFLQKHGTDKPEGAAVCSVVPSLLATLKTALEKYSITPLIVTHNLKTGLVFSIDNPEELGADRIANASAAIRLYGGNLIVVDFGTATTFCVLLDGEHYIGGAIMPGPGLSASSLAKKTAKLPIVELDATPSLPGKNTRENIIAGVIIGQAGATERIVRQIKENLRKEFKVIATGGYAEKLAPYISVIDHINPLLTLEGLMYIYELNPDKHSFKI